MKKIIAICLAILLVLGVLYYSSKVREGFDPGPLPAFSPPERIAPQDFTRIGALPVREEGQWGKIEVDYTNDYYSTNVRANLRDAYRNLTGSTMGVKTPSPIYSKKWKPYKELSEGQKKKLEADPSYQRAMEALTKMEKFGMDFVIRQCFNTPGAVTPDTETGMLRDKSKLTVGSIIFEVPDEGVSSGGPIVATDFGLTMYNPLCWDEGTGFGLSGQRGYNPEKLKPVGTDLPEGDGVSSFLGLGGSGEILLKPMFSTALPNNQAEWSDQGRPIPLPKPPKLVPDGKGGLKPPDGMHDTHNKLGDYMTAALTDKTSPLDQLKIGVCKFAEFANLSRENPDYRAKVTASLSANNIVFPVPELSGDPVNKTGFGIVLQPGKKGLRDDLVAGLKEFLKEKGEDERDERFGYARIDDVWPLMEAFLDNEWTTDSETQERKFINDGINAPRGIEGDNGRLWLYLKDQLLSDHINGQDGWNGPTCKFSHSGAERSQLRRSPIIAQLEYKGRDPFGNKLFNLRSGFNPASSRPEWAERWQGARQTRNAFSNGITESGNFNMVVDGRLNGYKLSNMDRDFVRAGNALNFSNTCLSLEGPKCSLKSMNSLQVCSLGGKPFKSGKDAQGNPAKIPDFFVTGQGFATCPRESMLGEDDYAKPLSKRERAQVKRINKQIKKSMRRSNRLLSRGRRGSSRGRRGSARRRSSREPFGLMDGGCSSDYLDGPLLTDGDNKPVNPPPPPSDEPVLSRAQGSTTAGCFASWTDNCKEVCYGKDEECAKDLANDEDFKSEVGSKIAGELLGIGGGNTVSGFLTNPNETRSGTIETANQAITSYFVSQKCNTNWIKEICDPAVLGGSKTSDDILDVIKSYLSPQAAASFPPEIEPNMIQNGSNIEGSGGSGPLLIVKEDDDRVYRYTFEDEKWNRTPDKMLGMQGGFI